MLLFAFYSYSIVIFSNSFDLFRTSVTCCRYFCKCIAVPAFLLPQHPQSAAGQHIHAVALVALPEKATAAMQVYPFKKGEYTAEGVVIQRAEQ